MSPRPESTPALRWAAAVAAAVIALVVWSLYLTAVGHREALVDGTVPAFWRLLALTVPAGLVLLGLGLWLFLRHAREMTRRLRATEHGYRTLFDEVPLGLYRTTPDGRFLEANRAMVRLLGYPDVESLLATPIGDLYVDPEDRERWRSRVMVERRLQGNEVRLRRLDGTVRWIRHSVRAVTDLAGEVSYEGAAEDVTEQKQTILAREASELRFRKIFEEGPLGMAIVGPDFRFLQANLRLCAMLDYAPGELEGRSFVEITHPDDLDADLVEARRLIAGEIPNYTIEKRYLRRDGQPLWIRLSGSVVRDATGEVDYFLAMIEDIDEHRRMMGELNRSNEELQSFAYIASHDLQEPLRIVTSYLQLLDRRLGERLDDDTRKFLDFALDGARRMQQLIRELLALSRIQTDPLDLGPVDLGDVLDLVLHDLEQAIAAVGAEVRSDSLPTVWGDEVQLKQLLQNLVSNAIKFHGSQPPRVEVAATRQAAEWRISVTDNGIGIPPEDLERIFRIFDRLHPREKYEGTGIGLAICSRIVDRHRGRLWVESVPGAGSTFHFTLPDGPDGAIVE